MDSVEMESEAYADGWDEVDRRQIFKIKDVESTIRHTSDDEQMGLATLPSVTLRPIGAQRGLFEIGERLGMGGMGEVRLARQPALQRDVAIKLVRANAGSTQSSRILLREALVMGYLEHPNIVPIHIVGRDETEELVVAMKRIEGDTLQERVDSGYRLSELDDNIEILIQVCNAVEFAHQRGIVHLDIKPANVMIGAFGEVYLLDWGTAVAYRNDVPDTIPRPLNDGRIRGTPAYMAPEMVTADPPSIATDIFLLGGLLYAILTGHGPNRGDSPEAVLECAYHSEPRPVPDAVPRELATIVNKCLARRPSERFLSAAELREALAGYLRRRTARDMLESARRSRDTFDALMDDDSTTVSQMYGAFGACKQLLVDARRAAEDPSYAKDELQSVIESMCRWELRRDNPTGAESLVHELPQLNPQLRGEIDQALAARSREQRELVELRRQVDPRVANKQKILLWLVIGFAIAVIYATPALFGYQQNPPEALFGHLGYLMALLLITVGLRDRLLDTRVNREVVGLVWVLSIFGLFVRIAAYIDALTLSTAIGLDLALVATMVLFGSWTIDRRVFAAVPWYLAGAAACFIVPDHAALIFGLAHGFALGSIAAAHAALPQG